MANVINKIKKGADEYDIQDPNAATKTELQALETTVSGKQDALTETQLAAVNSGIDSTKVGQISTNTTNIGTNTNDISTINGKIPAQASTSNQLADKAFVTDAVQTNSAHFRGNWATWNDVPTDPTEYPIDDDGNRTPTSNDYMVVQDASGFPTSPDPALEGTWRFKYSGVWSTNGKNGWHPEYQVNETPLTSDQLAALNSGITAEAVSKLSGIEAGAEVNEIDSISVNGTAVTPDANKNVALTIDAGIKTLTTADYDYPVDNPSRIDLNKLEPGVYKIGSNVNVQLGSTVSSSIATGAVLIVGRKNNNNMYFLTSPEADGGFKVGYYNRRFLSILDSNSIINSLTNTSPSLALSAAQGKVLNDNKADKTAFTGTDGTSAGTMGLVPAPATTDAGKVLGADGSWTGLPEGIRTLTTADYNWSSSGNPPYTAFNMYSADEGVYLVKEQMELRLGGPSYGNGTLTFGVGGLMIKSRGYLYYANSSDHYRWEADADRLTYVVGAAAKFASIQNNLQSTDTVAPLSANQGRILNNSIGDLTSLTTTAKTSAVAAINELDADLAKAQALSGSGAPTTSTAGTVGQFYIDTATGDIYYLSAIVEESGQPDSYTWNKVATGSVATIVQNTGNSTTNVMSQNAVTKTIFADTQNSRNIKIGYNASNTSGSSAGVAIGEYSNVSAGYGIALGHYAWAEAGYSIAIGGGTGTGDAPRVRAAHTVAIGDHIDARRCDYSVCIGQYLNGGSSMEYDGSIALGAYSGGSITAVGMMDIGSTSTSYGYNDSNYRLLTGVYDGQSAHDAATKGQLDSIAIKGAGAPTTSTTGAVGQLYEDTTNGKLYICTAIIPGTDPDPDTYTWEEVGGLAIDTTFWGQTASNGKVNGDLGLLGANSNNWTRTIAATRGSSTPDWTQNNPTITFGYRGTGETVPYLNLDSEGGGTNSAQIEIANDAGEGVTIKNAILRLTNHKITELADGTANTDAATLAQGNKLATSAPTTSTVGVLGQLYTDTTNMHTYQCTAINNGEYTWTQRW